VKRICVFCGSSEGARPAYADAARRLGAELVARKLGLVYGGCAVGLMGVVADAVLEGAARPSVSSRSRSSRASSLTPA